MKKIGISALLLFALNQQTQACAWYDPDYEYFNLFTQSIIKDKSYLPFLLSYSSKFYGDEVHVHDENIEAWQKFFGNKYNYAETEYLVNKVSYYDLNEFKKGTTNNTFLKKLGPNFYTQNKEAIDYLLQAKYMEPYMQIKFVGNPDNYYFSEQTVSVNASNLDFNKTMTALTNLYNAAKNPEIKLRYAYQIVRFNHYTQNYQQAVDAFKKYVEPLNLKSAPYYLALDQMAGALRGLGKGQDANWNFFKVFSFSKARKESAFTSMQLSDSTSFKDLMARAQSPEEKNMATFLLAYKDYSNPIPAMEKMYDIDPNSEILKVLAARSINELERSYLPIMYNSDEVNNQGQATSSGNSNENSSTKSTTSTTEQKVEKPSFWSRIVSFFKNLFGGSSDDSTERGANLSDKSYLNNPNRIPFFSANDNLWDDNDKVLNYIDDFDKFIDKTKDKSNDEFWKIASAYLKFLKKDYDASNDILNDIKTNNPEYLQEIKKMKALNAIVSQPKIDADFENKLMTEYKEYFIKPEKKASDSTEYYEYSPPSTSDFLVDILANRYFLQGEDGKAYLMNNSLSSLQYSPNADLAKKLQSFINKDNKTAFEKEVVSKNIDIKGNPDAFFNLIYGDQEMRNANFTKAKDYYSRIKDFGGLNDLSMYNNTSDNTPPTDPSVYNGFNNISPLVFGHNVWESFGSAETESMKAEPFAKDFPMIAADMNKLELANAAIELQKIGTGKDLKAAEANQLLGNMLYNSSILGYYRELFVMDLNNAGWNKYDFWKTDTPYKYYYKNYSYTSYIKPENFDLSINYYKKALDQTTDKDQKARILFQMASAEQGKYYQWESKQENNLSWDDPNYDQKRKAFDAQIDKTKNDKYRTYFAQLKQNYADTQSFKDLQSRCLYFKYYTTK
ncbi:hypothetical protein SAMN05660477_01923 [Soonwooa buanensis]|uniref:Tetratricopeptide repeat-containing protein n=1 Tax=Soonwooa buanensis TaxID=619805 RepID=A0A1T5FC30_9FLAO|nr:hypothetical protein [Soonwooa buanensis]SKB93702.1 hypothetical protein SAMN05660477_01923 [Soonwooa buanensis]